MKEMVSWYHSFTLEMATHKPMTSMLDDPIHPRKFHQKGSASLQLCSCHCSVYSVYRLLPGVVSSVAASVWLLWLGPSCSIQPRPHSASRQYWGREGHTLGLVTLTTPWQRPDSWHWHDRASLLRPARRVTLTPTPWQWPDSGLTEALLTIEASSPSPPRPTAAWPNCVIISTWLCSVTAALQHSYRNAYHFIWHCQFCWK